MIERQTNIPLAIVVAMAKTRVIGKDGTLPWILSDDLKWFKQVTMRKPIIMGRKTFQSIGKALPGRDNIVVTRNADFSQPDVTVAQSVEDAIAIAEAFAIARGAEEICVIGGGAIYAAAMSLISRIYLTEVDANIEGETRFPAFDRAGWAQKEAGRITRNARNDHDARMLILTRSTSD